VYILQCLHIYWFALFIIMGYVYSKTGQTVDIQQKAGDKYEKAAPEIVKVPDNPSLEDTAVARRSTVSSGSNEDALRQRRPVQ